MSNAMSEMLRAPGLRALAVIALVLLAVPVSQAGVIKVGSLVFQNTIPASQEVPGTNAFWLYWSSTLLPLSNVTLTVTGTDAQGQTFDPRVWTQATFDPTVPLTLTDALATNWTVTQATLTGHVNGGLADWQGQRYSIAEQDVNALLSNASGLVPFPLGPGGTGDAADVNVNPTPRSYYLAEGASVWSFETQVALANRGQADAPVTVTFLREANPPYCAGGPVSTTLIVPKEARNTVSSTAVPGLALCSYSIVVTSDEGVPLSVERTMMWDGGHGSHTGTAAEALSTVWYFAEGVQSWMDTYVLVANPGAETTDVTIKFFLPPRVDPGTGELIPVDPVTGTLTLGPYSRGTVWTGAIPQLAWKSFGMMVTATNPVVAERAVYFGTARRWDGGTLAMGVTATSLHWYFGEGALGSGFDEYLLMSNPSVQPATVVVDYLPARGSVVQRTYTVPAQARQTIFVTGEPLGLALPNGLGMRLTSDVPILAERAMYLRPDPANWHDGHASPGSTELGTVWEVADCVVGDFAFSAAMSATAAETFILLSNPGTEDSLVTVTYSREDGRPPVSVDHVVPKGGRLTVYANGEQDGGGTPLLSNERFGAGIVVKAGSPPIVVEKSVYWNSRGIRWASANNTVGTKLQ
jgi:hypothetical protein